MSPFIFRPLEVGSSSGDCTIVKTYFKRGFFSPDVKPVVLWRTEVWVKRRDAVVALAEHDFRWTFKSLISCGVFLLLTSLIVIFKTGTVPVLNFFPSIILSSAISNLLYGFTLYVHRKSNFAHLRELSTINMQKGKSAFYAKWSTICWSRFVASLCSLQASKFESSTCV